MRPSCIDSNVPFAAMEKLSIIVLCYNEELNIELLCDHLAQVASSLTPDYEVLLVDDGSTDATRTMMKAVRKPTSTSSCRRDSWR